MWRAVRIGLTAPSTASTTGAGTTNNTFCHDANGNLTADGVYVYLYDVENRLVEKRQKATTNCAAIAYDGAVVAQLRYDPMGRLFETIGTATGTTQMLYDGDKLAAEYDGTGALLRRYFWGDRTDEPVLYSEGANLDCANNRTQFLTTDRQGSIVGSADCYGNFIRAWRYDEYGIPQSSDGSALRPSNGARFLYTGQAFIPDAGLYYYKARMYSPSLGRFLQTDPIGYDDQINLYAYVGNDPVNANDPSGKEGVLEAIKYESNYIADQVRRLPSDIASFPAHALNGTTGLPPSLSGGAISAQAQGGAQIARAASLTPQARGVASEARVLKSMGMTKNTQSVATAEGRSVPDALTAKFSVEVKDTARVSLTKQLRIQTDAAAAAGKQSVLVTGTKTPVSGPAERAFNQVIRRDDLGPK